MADNPLKRRAAALTCIIDYIDIIMTEANDSSIIMTVCVLQLTKYYSIIVCNILLMTKESQYIISMTMKANIVCCVWPEGQYYYYWKKWQPNMNDYYCY